MVKITIVSQACIVWITWLGALVSAYAWTAKIFARSKCGDLTLNESCCHPK